MPRGDEVDHKMLEAFYFAYKDGKPYPSTIRDPSLKDINITVDEFISSQRRLMQKALLDGTKTQTSGGTIWSPNEITEKGINVIESDFDPLLRGIKYIDLGFSGKKYRFWKWIKKNITFMAIIATVSLILTAFSFFV